MRILIVSAALLAHSSLARAQAPGGEPVLQIEVGEARTLLGPSFRALSAWPAGRLKVVPLAGLGSVLLGLRAGRGEIVSADTGARLTVRVTPVTPAPSPVTVPTDVIPPDTNTRPDPETAPPLETGTEEEPTGTSPSEESSGAGDED